jgi:osmotically-inducible protein OsmY
MSERQGPQRYGEDDYRERQYAGARYRDEDSQWGRGFERDRYESFDSERARNFEPRFGQGRYASEQTRFGQSGYGQGNYSQGIYSQGGYGSGGYGQRGEYGQGQGSYGQSGYGRGGSARGEYDSRFDARFDQGSFDQGRYQESQRSYGQGQRFGQAPKGYKRSDERIREDVCDALMRRPDLDASDCEIQVKDGEVTLTGSVSRRDAKFAMEQMCEHVPGVKDVTNNLRVKQEQRGWQQSSSREEEQRGSNATRGGTGNSPNATRS